MAYACKRATVCRPCLAVVGSVRATRRKPFAACRPMDAMPVIGTCPLPLQDEASLVSATTYIARTCHVVVVVAFVAVNVPRSG